MSYANNLKKNVATTLVLQVLKLVLTFVNRTVFILALGIFYQGINGVFANLVSFFELFELGIGASITYFLYEPVAQGNYAKVKGILLYYDKIYRIMMLGMLLLGIGLLPFLQLFMKDVHLTGELYLIFLLYVLKVIFSYAFASDRSLMMARQKNYVLEVVDFVTFVVISLFQVLVLLVWKSFFLYMVAFVFYSLGRNFIVSLISRREQIYYQAKPQPVSDVEKKNLGQKVLGTAINRVATIIIFNTDNILISMFISVAYVGIYSNYVLIISGLTMLFNAVTNSMISSIAAYIKEQKGDISSLFYRQHWAIFSLIYLLSLSMLALVNPFISIWVGPTFDIGIVALVILNFAFNLYRRISYIYKSAYGLMEYDKLKDFFEILLNLGLSLVFLQVLNLGLTGILLGTLFANWATSLWYEPYILFKYGLQTSYKHYLTVFLRSWLLYLFVFGLEYGLLASISQQTWGVQVGGGILLVLIHSFIYLVCYRKKFLKLAKFWRSR